MSYLQENIINQVISWQKSLTEKANFYSSNKVKTREFLDFAKETSTKELKESLSILIKKPSVNSLLDLAKVITNTSSWVSLSYIRHLHGLIDFSQKDLKKKKRELSDPRIQQILNNVKNRTYPNEEISDQELFRCIYNELEYAYHNPDYESPLKMPNVNVTLMLVSGVFNELFSTPAFDRGAQHLFNNHGINYIHLMAKGTKGSDYNALLIREQIKKYSEENPDHKIWLVGFSKGGLDLLHYLAHDSDFNDENIIGLSCIASPIMGSEHLSHWLLKSLNSIHKYKDTKVYKYFDSKSDLMAKELQKSLSSKYLKEWFKNNESKLPKTIFYTAVAFESSWYESHLWMKLAKILFKSDDINDGIVDAKNAFFPNNFMSYRLGIIKGHHLIGNRSSYYSQEALLESHLIFLNYKGLI